MVTAVCSISRPYVDPPSDLHLPRNPKSEIVANSRVCLEPTGSTRSWPGREQINKDEGRCSRRNKEESWQITPISEGNDK